MGASTSEIDDSTIEERSVTIVHYVGRLVDDESGAVFDTSDVDVALAEGIHHAHRDYAPVEFRIGDGSVRPGIESAVRAMEEGETRIVPLDPEDAFGLPSDERIIEIPRDELETRSDTTTTEGELVGSETGETDETGWITDATDDSIEIDFNHELVGEPVEFEIRLLRVYDELWRVVKYVSAVDLSVSTPSEPPDESNTCDQVCDNANQ